MLVGCSLWQPCLKDPPTLGNGVSGDFQQCDKVHAILLSSTDYFKTDIDTPFRFHKNLISCDCGIFLGKALLVNLSNSLELLAGQNSHSLLS